MSACGSCQREVAPIAAMGPLLQIRRRYRARWNGLAFTLNSDSNQWTLCVQDAGTSETLYTAHRGGPIAAKAAAAEFAIFNVLGRESRVSPDSLARQLTWQECW